MFDKKYEKFPNGKIFYMIDRSTFEIRKTKIYGYQYTKKQNNFYVYAKMEYTSLSDKILCGIKKSWQSSLPNYFHTNKKDAVLFAMSAKKNQIHKRINDLEKQIEQKKSEIEEKKNKINSMKNEDIKIREGTFDNFCPNGSEIYL